MNSSPCSPRPQLARLRGVGAKVRVPRHALSAFVAVVVSACATPAVQVKVPTMTVAEAWNAAARPALPPSGQGLDARWRADADKTQAPVPVLSAPDVRMAYLKARTDASGNRHFGTWVAMQVRLPRWVLPDGSIDPREPGAALWQGMAPVPGLQGLSAVAGAAAGARPNAGERP